MAASRRVANLMRQNIHQVRRKQSGLNFSKSFFSATACVPGSPIHNHRLSQITNTTSISKRYVHTEGDKELVHFLQEEIAYEQENLIEEPKFHDFELSVDDTKAFLSKEFKGERIEVCFNVNENVNVDEGIIDDEEASLEEAMHQPDIVSYPQFNVKIVKSSGRTLQFHCTCNNIGEDMEGGESGQNSEEQFDLFRFDTLKVYEDGQSPDDVYEAETENIDGELYSNLMTTLLERGITGSFVNDLLELSTTVEHKNYLKFLKELQTFAADK